MDPELMLQMADQLEPNLRRQFLELIVATDGYVDVRYLHRLVTTGDVFGIWQLLLQAVLDGVMRHGDPLEELLLRSTESVHRDEPALELDLTLRNPEAERWAHERANVVLDGITAPDTTQITRLLDRGMTEGIDARKVARQIRALIGPTRDHQAALDRFAEAHMDRPDLTEQYRRRLVAYRADMIARTEAMRATNIGQLNRWLGQTSNPRAEVYWIVTDDDRLCKECAPMEGQPVLLDAFRDPTAAPFRSTHTGFPNGTPQRPRGKALRPDPYSQRRNAIGQWISKAVKSGQALKKRDRPRLFRTPPLHPHCRCTLGIRFPLPQ